MSATVLEQVKQLTATLEQVKQLTATSSPMGKVQRM